MICHVLEFDISTGLGKAIPASVYTTRVNTSLALDFYSKQFIEPNRSYSFFPRDFKKNRKFCRLELDYANSKPY